MDSDNIDLDRVLGAPKPRPFLDFLIQGTLAVVLLVALIYGIFEIGLVLGPLIPFAWEKQVSELALRDFPLATRGPEAEARRATLQRLADALVPYEHLPKGVTITINYSQDDTVNAFSTLGGNVVVYEGLIRRLPSENALSMVLGHEMGHVKNRDPISYMSGERLVQLVVSLATGDSGLASEVVSNIQLLTSLEFSRQAEERADLAGLTALEGHYGHVNGYRQTFDALEAWVADQGGSEPPEFLRDHPDTKTRIAKLAAYAAAHHWSEKGPLTPLSQTNYPPVSMYGDSSIPPQIKLPSSKPDTKSEPGPPDNYAPPN